VIPVGIENRVHRAAIDWLNGHPESSGFRRYVFRRLAALTSPVPGEQVTIRQMLRVARPALGRDGIQVDIHVCASDLHASARFYKAVGFDLRYDAHSPPCYVGDLGPTQILIYEPGPQLSVTRGLRVAFRLDDLEGAIERLTGAGTALERPAPRNLVLADDPDGNRITLKRRRRR
jgi:predicted enzyme related to lactoylglutathione lyase